MGTLAEKAFKSTIFCFFRANLALNPAGAGRVGVPPELPNGSSSSLPSRDFFRPDPAAPPPESREEADPPIRAYEGLAMGVEGVEFEEQTGACADG